MFAFRPQVELLDDRCLPNASPTDMIGTLAFVDSTSVIVSDGLANDVESSWGDTPTPVADLQSWWQETSAMSPLGEDMNLRLQMFMEQMEKGLAALSSALQSFSETQAQIIANLK